MRPLFLAVAAIMVMALPVAASQPDHWDHKSPICHRTAADSNPWVIITPDKASWYAHLDNHVNHTPKNGRGDMFAIEWSDGSWHCQQEPVNPPNAPRPPLSLTPPTPLTGSIRVTGYVCGDPRVTIRSRSTWTIKRPLSIRFVHARTGKVKVVTRMTRPGFKRYDRFWVKGGTRFVVRDGTTGEVLWKTETGRRVNVGACPR